MVRIAHDVVGGAFGYKMKENEHPSGLVNIWDFIGEEIDSGDSSDGPPLVPQGLEEISAEDFEEPCAALGTSGGTAAFYCLRYREQRAPQGVPVDFFIGKDLAHASDELEFYAKLQFATKNSQPWTCFAQDGHVLSRGVATGMYQSQKSGEEPPPDSLVGKLATRI